MRSLSPAVLVLLVALALTTFAGIAAILLGIERIRGKPLSVDQRFLYVGIIVLLAAGVFILFHGR